MKSPDSLELNLTAK